MSEDTFVSVEGEKTTFCLILFFILNFIYLFLAVLCLCCCAQAFSSCSLQVSCLAACGIFPDQGSNPCFLHCRADSWPFLATGPPGKPSVDIFDCHDQEGEFHGI